MSKKKLHEITRTDLFDKLKEIYQRIDDIYMIDAVLYNESLEDYSLNELKALYNDLSNNDPVNDLADSQAVPEKVIVGVYGNPYKALSNKQPTLKHLEQCFVEFAKIYIKEYLALEILLKSDIYTGTLFEMIGVGNLLAAELDSLSLSPPVSVHVEQNEEKHFQAEEVPSAIGESQDPVVDRVVALSASKFYNPIEIIELLSYEFPTSEVFIRIKEMEGAGIKASEIIGSISGENI